jgi:choline-sulfatase
MGNSRRCAIQVLACLVTELAIVAACGGERRDRPNVLLVTVDTLRADRVGAYGYGLARTPAMDALAAEGVRCLDATTVAPITLPAHASIMTGLYPPAHRVRDNGNYALAPDAVTLAERLRAAGYQTAAFVSAAVLARRYGLAQGFDTYDDDLWAEDAPDLFMIRERPAERTAAQAVAWLERWRAEPRGPFFAWVHFFDPHEPHPLPPIDLAAMTPTAYDAEVALADRGVARIVDWLRATSLLDETLVILTADHGESLGEHGEPTHGVFLYDATMRVPLVWRLPGVLPAGATYAGPVRHIDVVATALAILGLPPPRSQGEDLLAAFQGRTPGPALPQYLEARLAEEGFGMAPLAGVRTGGFKWIRAPRPELYDLGADPRERTNRFSADAGRAAVLDATLERMLEDSERHALPQAANPMDRETEEMLLALGYLAPPEQRAEMAGIDPKDGMAIYAMLQAARQLAQLERWDEATAILHDVLARAPANVTARNVLALAAVRRGDLEAAEREYRRSLEHQPRQHRVVGALGQLALRRGHHDEAEARFRDALAIAPEFVEAMSNLGLVAALRGNDAAAERWYERALAVDPTYPHVQRRLADLFYDRKDYARARRAYERVLASLPGHFQALVQAGNACRFLGDETCAKRFYEEAARRRPDSWIPPYNLACLDALAGRRHAAFDALDLAIARGLGSPSLLERNDDFASLRASARWTGLVGRARQRSAKPTAARQGAGGVAGAAGSAPASGVVHTSVGSDQPPPSAR